MQKLVLFLSLVLLSGCNFYTKSVCDEVGKMVFQSLEGTFYDSDEQPVTFTQLKTGGYSIAVGEEKEVFEASSCVVNGRRYLEFKTQDGHFGLINFDQPSRTKISFKPGTFELDQMQKRRIPVKTMKLPYRQVIADNKGISAAEFVRFFEYLGEATVLEK